MEFVNLSLFNRPLMLIHVLQIQMEQVVGLQIPKQQDFVFLAIYHHMLFNMKINVPVNKYLIKVNVNTHFVIGQIISVFKINVQVFKINLNVLNKDIVIGRSVKINVIQYQYH